MKKCFTPLPVRTKMKKALIVVLLLSTLLPATHALAFSPSALDKVIEDWCSRLVEPINDLPAYPSAISREAPISQHDALCSAAQALIRLGLETSESLSKQYSVECGFSFLEFYDLYVWHINLYILQNGRRLTLYSIQVDANSGQLFSLLAFGSFYASDPIYAYNLPKLPERYWEQPPSMDALLDHWDRLYSESPMYSPEIQRREMQGYPLPGQDDMPQRTALRIVVQMAIALSGRDMDVFYDYTPRVEFDVSPAASRWSIILLSSPGEENTCEAFFFTLDAKTQTLERLIWRNAEPVGKPSL